MADQPLIDTNTLPDVMPEVPRAPRPVRATPRSTPRVVTEALPNEQRRSFVASLDGYLLVIVGILLAIGLMMVYSTTFDWSYQTYGNEATIFLQHLRNAGIGIVVMLVVTIVDYRLWRRLAVPLLLITIGALVAVLLFGDDVFGARRSLINGSFQPSELAELVTVIYMAAWLSSRRTQIRSITYGLLPFSTAATVVAVAGIMFFLAGADLVQLAITAAIVGVIGFVYVTNFGPDYAHGRISSYVSSVADVTQADYHVQQAIIAFNNGGLTGVGLGQGKQKYGNLPAPHTDSIFAVIGEELGLMGAALVVGLYIVLVIRGIQVARRSVDHFGALLAAGLTIWIAIKALLNIAVMTAVVPPTGAPLPFISFGGSSLVVLLAGTGLLLSISRVRARQTLPKWSAQAPERRNVIVAQEARRPRVTPSNRTRRKVEDKPTFVE